MLRMRSWTGGAGLPQGQRLRGIKQLQTLWSSWSSKCGCRNGRRRSWGTRKGSSREGLVSKVRIVDLWILMPTDAPRELVTVI